MPASLHPFHFVCYEIDIFSVPNRLVLQNEPLLRKSAWPDTKDPGALLDVVGVTFVDHVLRSPRDVLLLVYVM
jgi:hypothetical protein